VGLQILIRQSAGVAILDLQGRATIGRDNDTLHNHLRKLINDGARKVLLNLEGLTQVDSSSLSTIVRASVTLARQGGALKFLKPRSSVKLVLETLHLLDAIPAFEDEAHAMASFGKSAAPAP
jgi:anti-anti-sigma factor